MMHRHLEIARHEVRCEEAKAAGRSDGMTYREAITLIYRHDEHVHQHLRHLRLVEETKEAGTNRIVQVTTHL